MFVYDCICAFISEIMAFVDLLEVFEEDLERIIFFADEIDSGGYESEDEQRSLRMVEFYGCRVDIFDIFDDGKMYETFRFQKKTIFYIASLIEDKIGRKNSKKEIIFWGRTSFCSLAFLCHGNISNCNWKCATC